MAGIGAGGRTRLDVSRKHNEDRVSTDLSKLQAGSVKKGWSKKRPGSGLVKK